MVRRHITLSSSLMDLIMQDVDFAGTSFSQIIERLLIAYYAQRNQQDHRKDLY